jgi:hypothetical protein
MKFFIHLPVIIASLFLASCASPTIPRQAVSKSDPRAVAIVKASQKAQGGAELSKYRKAVVEYDGKWAAVGPKFQPVVVDRDFRKTSAETVGLQSGIVQEHQGPAGRKRVEWDGRRVKVSRNGVVDPDKESDSAAALVAECYRLFLLGPHFFNRPGVTFAYHGTEELDGENCDVVLAVLRPGFGFSAEDRVLLSVGNETRLLRRVQMTLEGVDSTKGAEVDVLYSNFQTKQGVTLPHHFFERIRSPFKLDAHRWDMKSLRLER